MSRDFDYRQYAMGRVKPLCLEAVATMRRFVDDAEREVNRENTAPEEMIERVMHRFAWGAANASSSLASAINALAEVRKVRDATLDAIATDAGILDGAK